MRYFDRLKQVAPKAHALLRPAAAEPEIAALETTIGQPLPAGVRSLLALADGQDPKNELGVVYGLQFLSCDEIAYEWKTWKKVRDAGGLEELDEDQNILKKGTIQPRYTTAGWIPLFRFPTRADYLGVDLEPGKKGKKGQIINFGRDEEDKYVAAADVGEFLELVDGWLDKESKGKDAAVVENHVLDLLARAGLAMERCQAIADGDDFELEPPPAPSPKKPAPASTFTPPAAIADEARRFLEVVDAELKLHGRRPVEAKLEIERKGNTTSGGLHLKIPKKGWWPGESQAFRPALEALFVAAAKHGLPTRLHITYVREGSSWSREVKTFCS